MQRYHEWLSELPAAQRMMLAALPAEERLKRNRKAVFKSVQLPQQVPPNDDVAPFIRGACSLKNDGGEGAHRRPILEFRANNAILNFVNGKDIARYARAGLVTPDHVIRTKPWPLILAAPQLSKLGDFQRAARKAAQKFIDGYTAYFAATRRAAKARSCTIRRRASRAA